jgi:cell division protein ZapB
LPSRLWRRYAAHRKSAAGKGLAPAGRFQENPMSTELFNRLEQKVASAVEALELLKMEAEELREENSRLKQEREEWESRIEALLGKFDEVDVSSS